MNVLKKWTKSVCVPTQSNLTSLNIYKNDLFQLLLILPQPAHCANYIKHSLTIRVPYDVIMQPENLLLDASGCLKVSDFGLSALPQQVRVSIIFSIYADLLITYLKCESISVSYVLYYIYTIKYHCDIEYPFWTSFM